ncbi:hypothetical protein [Microbacterium paludicola]|uniref:Uncharacterized protein n=1 Tax=Microbacterium paludicola TaxID=300019 RepID=A0A4Y9FWM5_9MICO|nr:hypothetical protein [Microbacterium paludicola]MBF0816662.1 hypothetical protein [Microbacterium paludicola]TFU32642.1 hypothetical protein E4U02_09565 [Microbacterium paludicola]
MSTISRETRSALRGRIRTLFAESERGAVTLEQVLWAAGIGIVAVAVIAGIVAIINSFAAQIPTGL